MNKFIIQIDPMIGEKYINVPFVGQQLVEHPIYNKGSAYTEVEREQLGLYGIFPRYASTIKEQLRRVYENYSLKTTPIEKFIFLLGLLDRNETLFYRLVLEHTEEMLPIVYTPTVGEVAKTYSHRFRRPRGLYIPDDQISHIDRILANAPFSNINLIVVTDGERILGLGDQGVGGMAIPVGKISLYVVGAGIHPALCLPIILDVGTNNEELLKDPLYLGLKHKRLTGDRYDEVIEEFVKGVKRHFPHTLIQWEDFGKHHALSILNRYRERLCSFDDDIQGTGAVTVAALCSAIYSQHKKLKDQHYVFFGFGQAGYGIATLLVHAMLEEGLTVQAAKERIYPIGHNGLVFEDMNPHQYQMPFARKRAILQNWQIRRSDKVDLFDTVLNAKATVLIGTSGIPNAFTNEILSQMAKNAEKPVIFALSNPNNKCECLPENAFQATEGRCIMATGSPFPKVTINETTYNISQCNNMYIFPGLGLGAIISMTPKVTDQMLVVASKALAAMVPLNNATKGILLPDIHNIRKVSENVAFAVAKEARDSGLGIRLSDDKLRNLIKQAMWKPEYLPYRHET
ncbi:MAG: NAD-dependent malic enzyme [Gammaproteobacteria bacterium]|nr:MAG: NAD-dependent malic enzyme [Gammaproteobacteria bacterium]RKZ42861.1 MAG: NAD-dependent malic enzyme [Gammaproteobacteria bacterium]RKZ74389.1 MAG: NAD-dependent malic enzyme [Gammaproteobacteria bacterium]